MNVSLLYVKVTGSKPRLAAAPVLFFTIFNLDDSNLISYNSGEVINMAATKTQLKLQATPANGDSVKTTSLGFIGNFADSDTSAVAAAVDAASKAFNSLTTDTYSDCLLIETFSVNEILAE